MATKRLPVVFRGGEVAEMGFAYTLAHLLIDAMSHDEALRDVPACDCDEGHPRSRAAKAAIHGYAVKLAAVVSEALAEMHVVGVAVSMRDPRDERVQGDETADETVTH